MKKIDDDTFLARWLNEDLTKEELQRFKASEDYAVYKKLADRSTKFEAPNFKANEIKALIMKNKSGVKTTVRTLYYTIASIAAVLIISFFAGNYFWTPNTTSYIASVGERVNFELPDGSLVTLNGLSKIEFDNKNWEKNIRTLNLEGEAYFRVKKGSTFSVKTPKGKVSVLGTQFSVKEIGTYFAVNCFEGKVRVDKETKTNIIAAGQGIKYLEQQKELITFKNTKPLWINNQYKYNKAPLEEILTDLQNVYKIKVYTENVKKTQKFSGNLITNNLKEALLTVTKPLNLQFSIAKDSTVHIKGDNPNE